MINSFGTQNKLHVLWNLLLIIYRHFKLTCNYTLQIHDSLIVVNNVKLWFSRYFTKLSIDFSWKSFKFLEIRNITWYVKQKPFKVVFNCLHFDVGLIKKKPVNPCYIHIKSLVVLVVQKMISSTIKTSKKGHPFVSVLHWNL